MTSHEEMLERMRGSNPLPDIEMITDGQLAEMTLQVEEARRTGQASERPQELTPVRPRVWWLRPAVAFAGALLVAFAVVGAVSLTTGGESDVADEPSSTKSPETTAPSTTSATVNPPPDGWNPVLATTLAGPVPEPATCPAGTDPTGPGPDDQDRPALGSSGLLSAAFDHHTGQVIYVDEESATWAFDVCTTTWANLLPTGAPTGNISDGLVYDVDSDLTVSIEPDEIFVYDASSNTWEWRANTSGSADWPLGAAYDPVSGLIVTSSRYPNAPGSDDWLIEAYDVETDTWHNLGVVPLSRETPCCTGIDLLGYSAELDRLVLTTYVDDQEATLLLDPRTGEMSTHIIPTPVVNLGWPSGSYGQAETVYVQTAAQVANGRWNTVLCGFDPNEIAWSRCHVAPAEFPALKHDQLNAIVGDPINDRLLLLGGTYNTFSSSPPGGTDDVWAIDLASGGWTEVVAPTDTHIDTADGPVPNTWSSLLGRARSHTAPEPATCPEGTNPNMPGPIGQERPTTVDDDHDGAFDRRTGRVMYVDTMQRTWAFDVCTNTWQNLEPEGIPIDRSLVYDVDSDVTIALGPALVSAYDATSNEWNRPQLEIIGSPGPTSFSGVTYDPVSGLVITTADNQVWALDVEAGRLTMIDAIPYGGQLAGYVKSLDRLVFVSGGQTVLVDPRNGEAVGGGKVPESGWGIYDFFEADGTVFIGAVGIEGRGTGCEFNAETLAWDRCYEGLSPTIESFSSRVEDRVNGRVVLIHHHNIVRSGVADVSGGVANDVWALDPATGEMTELLQPSD